MNPRIRELAGQAGLKVESFMTNPPKPFQILGSTEQFEKFAELIVRECIKTIEYRAPGQMGKIGEGWTNGYDDGLKTGAWLIKEHFGVES